MKHKVLVINGPNLNLLGLREPEIYGKVRLIDINNELEKIGQNSGVVVECFQSNIEGELVEKTQEVFTKPCDFLIVNPAGLTHTSIVWRDALLAIKKPFIEIHLTNVFARENFRHKSYFSDIAVGVISGLSNHGYSLALSYALNFILEKD